MNESTSVCDEGKSLGPSTSKDNPVDLLLNSDDIQQDDNSDLGPLSWIHRQITSGADPRDLINELMPGAMLPSFLDDFTLWKLIFELLTEPPPREKLSNANTLNDVVSLLQTRKNIVVLTGAGVSVACGIPDFRSRDGVYARLSKDFPDLPDPQAMFDIKYFKSNPKPFFKFAKEIYPGQFVPSLSHRFISLLEKKEILLRNYTQNIDTLEQVAGISRLVQCHGSFATASCTNCKLKVESNAVKEDIFNQVIPKCPQCPDDPEKMAVMKPDIVFFGENLNNEFYETIEIDKTKVDLLIVIGSSLKVRPVALIPNLIDSTVPQILINREPLPHFNFDIELLGNCDAVICHLCNLLGNDWNSILDDYEMPILDNTDKDNIAAAIANEIDENSIMDSSQDGHIALPVVDTDTKQSELDHLFHSTVNSEHSDLLDNIQHIPSSSTALVSPHKISDFNPVVSTENVSSSTTVESWMSQDNKTVTMKQDGFTKSSTDTNSQDSVSSSSDLESSARQMNKDNEKSFIYEESSSSNSTNDQISSISSIQEFNNPKSSDDDSNSCKGDSNVRLKLTAEESERPLTPTGSKRKRSVDIHHGEAKEPKSSNQNDRLLESELCSGTDNVHIDHAADQDEFYLHIPPSRYVFHGAELGTNLIDSSLSNSEETDQSELGILQSDNAQHSL